MVVLFALCTIGLSCNQKVERQKKNLSRPLIILQPLELNDSSALDFLKDSISHFYPVDVIIAAEKKFPETLFYKRKDFYIGKNYRCT